MGVRRGPPLSNSTGRLSARHRFGADGLQVPHMRVAGIVPNVQRQGQARPQDATLQQPGLRSFHPGHPGVPAHPVVEDLLAGIAERVPPARPHPAQGDPQFVAEKTAQRLAQGRTRGVPRIVRPQALSQGRAGWRPAIGWRLLGRDADIEKANPSAA